jgi:hypothetical protein
MLSQVLLYSNLIIPCPEDLRYLLEACQLPTANCQQVSVKNQDTWAKIGKPIAIARFPWNMELLQYNIWVFKVGVLLYVIRSTLFYIMFLYNLPATVWFISTVLKVQFTSRSRSTLGGTMITVQCTVLYSISAHSNYSSSRLLYSSTSTHLPVLNSQFCLNNYVLHCLRSTIVLVPLITRVRVLEYYLLSFSSSCLLKKFSYRLSWFLVQYKGSRVEACMCKSITLQFVIAPVWWLVTGDIMTTEDWRLASNLEFMYVHALLFSVFAGTTTTVLVASLYKYCSWDMFLYCTVQWKYFESYIQYTYFLRHRRCLRRVGAKLFPATVFSTVFSILALQSVKGHYCIRQETTT